MEQKIILLSGVHGVGKGYYLKKNFAMSEKFTILEASTLIKRYKAADDAGYKRVKDISNNQDVLLTALLEEQKTVRNNIILDGHLCLLDSKGELECIPEDFIIKASIDGIILLQDKAEVIVQRQAIRDGKKVSCELVDKMQKEERNYCEMLFSKYNILYSVIDSNCDYNQFCQIVNRM